MPQYRLGYTTVRSEGRSSKRQQRQRFLSRLCVAHRYRWRLNWGSRRMLLTSWSLPRIWTSRRRRPMLSGWRSIQCIWCPCFTTSLIQSWKSCTPGSTGNRCRTIDSTDLQKYLHFQGKMATARLKEVKATSQKNTLSITDRNLDWTNHNYGGRSFYWQHGQGHADTSLVCNADKFDKSTRFMDALTRWVRKNTPFNVNRGVC